MKHLPEFTPRAALLILAASGFLMAGCVTKRTVKEGGRTVDEEYIIKRPVKNILENTRVE